MRVHLKQPRAGAEWRGGGGSHVIRHVIDRRFDHVMRKDGVKVGAGIGRFISVLRWGKGVPKSAFC